jgi:CRP/FNR family transcriptional regulator, cyclic AMP receptor protein
MSAPYGLQITENCVICKLRHTGFFCDLPKQSVEDLDKIKYASAFPPGAVLFVEGQAPRGVYVICTGRVKLTTTSRDGKTLILRIAQAGEVLGLHGTVSGRPYELTAETLQPCQLDFVKREDFLKFLQSHADACLHAAQHLSHDCQSAYEMIRSLGLSHSVSEKLARLLLEWAHGGEETKDGIRIKIALTHEEIAQLIGTSRETVTRVLGEFREKEFAHLRGSTLLIRNKAALEKLIGA